MILLLMGFQRLQYGPCFSCSSRTVFLKIILFEFMGSVKLLSPAEVVGASQLEDAALLVGTVGGASPCAGGPCSPECPGSVATADMLAMGEGLRRRTFLGQSRK